MKELIVSATEFKAKCLALLDEVHAHGGTVTITKRGKPVARLGAVQPKAASKISNALAGLLSPPKTVRDFDLTHLFEEDVLVRGPKR